MLRRPTLTRTPRTHRERLTPYAAVALAVGLCGALTLAVPAAPTTAAPAVRAAAVTLPGTPAAVIETSNLGTIAKDRSSTSLPSRVRVVLSGAAPAGVSSYRVVRYSGTSTAISATMVTCAPTSMRNGSGSSGCYFDLSDQTSFSYYGLQARNAAGWGAALRFGASDLIDKKLGNHTTVELGTREQVFVTNNLKETAALAYYGGRMLKAQLPACVKEEAIKVAMDQLEKRAGKEFPKFVKNPVSATAYAGAYVVYSSFNDNYWEAFSNPCEPLKSFATNLADAVAQAFVTGTPQEVMVQAAWVDDRFTWTNPEAIDLCVAYPGKAEQSVGLPKTSFDRPKCYGFWGSMVS